MFEVLMDRDKIKRILDEGINVYSDSGLGNLSRWAETFNGKESYLVAAGVYRSIQKRINLLSPLIMDSSLRENIFREISRDISLEQA